MDTDTTSPASAETSVGPESSRPARRKFGSSFKFYGDSSITLEMPSEISRILNELMNRTDHDPEELYFLGLLIYKAAIDAEEAGHRMAIVDSEGDVVQNITDL
jgi:hypothetical protein